MNSTWDRHNQQVCGKRCWYCAKEKGAGNPTLRWVKQYPPGSGRPKGSGTNRRGVTNAASIAMDGVHPTKGPRRRTTPLDRHLARRAANER